MLRIALAFLILLTPSLAIAEGEAKGVQLYMAEEKGCYYCAKWNKEISHIYPKTNEGKVAPLQRFDIRDDEVDVEFSRRVTYTPTFILVKDGIELGRIEGYPGEDAFWWLLTKVFLDAQISTDKTS